MHARLVAWIAKPPPKCPATFYSLHHQIQSFVTQLNTQEPNAALHLILEMAMACKGCLKFLQTFSSKKNFFRPEQSIEVETETKRKMQNCSITLVAGKEGGPVQFPAKAGCSV